MFKWQEKYFPLKIFNHILCCHDKLLTNRNQKNMQNILEWEKNHRFQKETSSLSLLPSYQWESIWVRPLSRNNLLHFDIFQPYWLKSLLICMKLPSTVLTHLAEKKKVYIHCLLFPPPRILHRIHWMYTTLGILDAFLTMLREKNIKKKNEENWIT